MPLFGVAGYPPAFKRSPFGKDRLKICHWLESLGLDALELQMTYGPRTKPEKCLEYRKAAQDCGIKLSVHASYFIVFTSDDPKKLERSRETLKRTFELCDILGADAAILHPGSLYGNSDPAPILARCEENLGQAMDQIGKTDIGLFVETAGKVGQLGSVDEILHISEQIDGVYPCIDFGHVHARTLGSLDSDQAIFSLFEKLGHERWLTPEQKIHFHYTPIRYGPRGEIRHQAIHDEVSIDRSLQLDLFAPNLPPQEPKLYGPRPQPVAEGFSKWNVEATVISETHNSQEEGALALKDYHNNVDLTLCTEN